MVPPRSSARGFALALLRPTRIAIRRAGVVRGIVPIAAPLVHIVTKVVNAKRVRSILRHDFGTVQPASGIVRQGWRRIVIVAPGKLLLLHVAARCPLPLRLAGKPVGPASLRCEAFAVILRFAPRNASHRLLRMVKIRVVAKRRSW